MQSPINVSLDQTQPIHCKKCDHNIFTEGVILRKLSKILSGTAQDALVPITIMYCTKCQEVLEETLPTQLKEKIPPPADEIQNEGGAKIIPFK